MRISPRRALVAALASLTLLCVFAAGARAYDVTRVTSQPAANARQAAPLAAAAHPDLVTTIDFDSAAAGSDTVRSLQIGLAPGMVAYVNHIPICDRWDASSRAATAGCEASQIGSTSTAVRLPLLPPPVPPTATLPGRIFNIAPPAGSPAAFGIEITGLTGPVKLIATISVNPSDLGLVATLDGLPRTAEVALGLEVPIHIESITQTLFGYVGDNSFFTNPTSCIPAATTISTTSYDGVTASGSDAFTPDDCAGVPFGATFATAADPSTPDSTSAISFNVQPSALDVPRVSSHVRSTTVVAPPGVLLNAALAANLDACTDAGFAQSNTAVAANCPASSEVGSIEFVSPILGRFPGKVFFGTQTPTDRLRLFLDVPLFGAHIKVSATVNPDNTTGQITTVFSDLPQIAFTSFRLTFNGGPRSALVTPATCGVNTAQAIVGPWSGGRPVSPTGTFETTAADCAPKFTPSMGTGVSTSQAGASPAFTLSFDRPDRTTPVGRVAFDLPPGLVGALGMPGLTKCSLANAAAGACEDSSRVGSVQSVVGSGSEPPTLPGSVYLTEPKVAGDPAGLSVKVPARLGPVDAGTVIVGQRLILGGDGGLDVLSDPIPALQFGIPLAIRRLTVTIDRQGFMRNPTSCGVKQSNGAFEALGGATATASSTLTVDGCDRLPFAPKIEGTIGGRGQNRPGDHPAFKTVIRQAAGQAALKSAVVTLPRAVSTNLDTVKAACDPAVFAQRACPRRTLVATAKAVSPLISNPLAGDAYLVKVGSGSLPKLVVQLRGEVSLDLEGIVTIDRSGRVVTTFGAIPDLALSSFELAFRPGAEGVLTTVGDICAAPILNASFVGQNGKATRQRPRLVVNGCRAVKPKSRATLRFRRGSGTLTVKTTVAKRLKPVASVRVGLPRGLRLGDATVTAKAGRKRAGRRAIKVKGRAIAVKLPRRGARSVTIRVTGVTAGSRLARRLAARRGKVTLSIATRLTNRARSGAKVRAKLK